MSTWECKCQWSEAGFIVQVSEDCPEHGREARPGAWELQDALGRVERGEHPRPSEQGFALAFTLIVLACLTAGALAVSQLALSAGSSVRNDAVRQADEAAAEGVVYVMLDQIRESPTATSMPPAHAAIDGSHVATATASYDVLSGLWTVSGVAGQSSVTIVARRTADGLKRESWSSP